MSHSGEDVDYGGGCVCMGAGGISEISVLLSFAMYLKLLEKKKTLKKIDGFVRSRRLFLGVNTSHVS